MKRPLMGETCQRDATVQVDTCGKLGEMDDLPFVAVGDGVRIDDGWHRRVCEERVSVELGVEWYRRNENNVNEMQAVETADVWIEWARVWFSGRRRRLRLTMRAGGVL
jgi:hypothetical protein